MYERHFGLRENPFRLQANPDYLYLSPKHDKALATLEYGLAERKGFVVLVGEIGAGKTTLLNYVLNRLPEEVNVAFVFHTNLNKSEFLELILTEFEVESTVDGDSDRLYALYDFLLEEHHAGRRVVLMVDEAQNLGADVLEQIRLLANLETDQQPLLQIILAGQPGLRQTLGQPALEQLRQRVGVTYHLMPLDEAEIGDYIRFRLNKAEAPSVDLFEDDTFPLIYRHTHGVPRLINKLADAALLAAFADDLARVSAALLADVIAEQQAEGEIPPLEATPAAASLPASNIDPALLTLLDRITLCLERLESKPLPTAGATNPMDRVVIPVLDRVTLCLERLEEATRLSDERHSALQKELQSLLQQVHERLDSSGEGRPPRPTVARKKSSWFS